MKADKIRKLKALMNDKAATENEREICARLIESYKNAPDDYSAEKEYDWREDLYKNLHEMWTTRDGRRLHIKDMDAGHLINTIFYIRRTLDNDDLLKDIPIYQNMIKEAEKRGFAGAIYAGQAQATHTVPPPKERSKT